MALTTESGYLAACAAGQHVRWFKTSSITTVANIPFQTLQVAGDPGAGTLAGSSTAAGVVPDDTTAGFPSINAFGGGATGYVNAVDIRNSVACTIDVYDCLFKAGAYAFNASTSLGSQPSYSGRIPGADYRGTEIWIEAVTAFTGNLSVAVTYTNQSGTNSRTTGTVATGAALIVGRMVRLPFQSGDTGVMQIDSVTGTVASVGTFNVLVLRRLTPPGRVGVAGGVDRMGRNEIGLPIVFADSALMPILTADSTASGTTAEARIHVING